MKRLGVIIVHFGEKTRTIHCLESLIRALHKLKNILPIEATVLVVDNLGNLSLKYCKVPTGIEIRYFKPSKNLGYAGACYLGAKLLRNSTLLLFSNNDILFSENSLIGLIKAVDSLPAAGAIQPLVLTSDCLKIDSLGSTSNNIMYYFGYSNLPIKYRLILLNDLKIVESFGIEGAVFIIKKTVWENIGGWDPLFFMFNEDSLLSWKLRLSGYKNYVVLNSIVYHERGGTAKGHFIKKDPIFSSYYSSRNKFLSTLYIHEGYWLIIYFCILFLFEFIKNLILSIENRTGVYLYYYIRALIFVLKNRKHIVSERRKIQRKYNAMYFLKNNYTLSIKISLAWLIKSRKIILDNLTNKY